MLTLVTVLAITLGTFMPAGKALATPANAAPYIPPGAAPDLVAYIKNGHKPVLTPLEKMTPSSTGFATEVGPPTPIPGCVQPPAHYDPLSLTPAQMQAYGIAPRTPGEPLSKWLKYEAHVGHHVCVTQSSNAVHGWNGAHGWVGTPGMSASLQYTNDMWGGKVADQNCGSQGQGIACQDFTHNYIETDTDYYVSCPSYTPQVTNSASAVVSNICCNFGVGIGGW